MGSRCVTGRLLLVVVRRVVRPDRNVDAPVDGGGRSLTDCVARLVSAPILARSWTTSVARVNAPASSILRPSQERNRSRLWFARRKSFEKSFACRDRAARTQRARPMTRRPSSSRAQFLIASSSPTLSNPPELPNYSIHTLPLIHRTTWLHVPGRDIGRLSRCGLTSVQSLHALACRP